MVKESILGRIKMFGKNVFVGNDKRIEGLLSKLDRLTKSEDLLVGAETLILTKRTEKTVENVQVSIKDQDALLKKMSGGVDRLLSAAQEAKEEAKVERDIRHLEAVMRMLEPSFLPQDCFDGIKREHLPESGDWIWSETQMQAWVASKTPILWISGNPGSGKSFLVYNIVTHLEETYQGAIGDASRVSVGYFFFRDNQDQTRSFEKALRNIAYQIAQTNPAYAKYVAGLSISSPTVSSVQSAWRKLFTDYFVDGDTKAGSGYVILDGIDESNREDRSTFFALLNDIQQTGSRCRLHIVMLGRPQIVDEMEQSLNGSIPTIQVDRLKTSGDIARYVELSISKSKVLSRVSETLKRLIVRTLSAKAEGMFMWVKLMIAELGKKSRESAIKESLNKAPTGLIKMLRHILESFSATLTEEDAIDFNNMLAWVALAKRPLTLGELDVMLRLQSTEGDAVLFLEGKLRKQYASFFTLTREDSLSTADLFLRRTELDEDKDADAQTGTELVEGLDDVENETDFSSNPSTTTVAFSHSSISDFFRDPKEGKVTAVGADCPPVGVHLGQARFSIACTCIDLIADSELPHRVQDTATLRLYAATYWKQHLDEIDDSLGPDGKVQVGLQIANMMRDEYSLEHWCKASTYLFYKEDVAEQLLAWINNPRVLEKLSEESSSWYHSVQKTPLELFDPAMRYVSNRWLNPEGSAWSDGFCVLLVSS